MYFPHFVATVCLGLTLAQVMAPSLISYPSQSVSSLLSSLAFISVQNIPLGLKFFLGIRSTALATCVLNFNLVTTL